MKNEEKLTLKKRLWEKCLTIQNEHLERAKKAVLIRQQSTLGEDNDLEDKFESFLSDRQVDRDLFAKRVVDNTNVLRILNKINPDKAQDVAGSGAIVITDDKKMFLSVGIGDVELDGEHYFVISPVSPIGQAVLDKKKGDQFEFRGEKGIILDVF